VDSLRFLLWISVGSVGVYVAAIASKPTQCSRGSSAPYPPLFHTIWLLGRAQLVVLPRWVWWFIVVVVGCMLVWLWLILFVAIWERRRRSAMVFASVFVCCLFGMFLDVFVAVLLKSILSCFSCSHTTFIKCHKIVRPEGPGYWSGCG